MKKSKIWIGFLLLFVVIACKKEAATDEKKDMLTGTWQVSNYEVNTGGSSNWTVVTDLNCRKSQTETFGSDGVYRLQSGQCDLPQVPAPLLGRWKFTGDYNTITLSYDAYAGEYDKTVVALTETQLILQWDAGNLGGDLFRTTYTKQ